MNYNKAQEIAEKIADQNGIYGIGEAEGDHSDDCKCRICFVLETTEKLMRDNMSMNFEKMLNKLIDVINCIFPCELVVLSSDIPFQPIYNLKQVGCEVIDECKPEEGKCRECIKEWLKQEIELEEEG